jgi:hypothetical protein
MLCPRNKSPEGLLGSLAAAKAFLQTAGRFLGEAGGAAKPWLLALTQLLGASGWPVDPWWHPLWLHPFLWPQHPHSMSNHLALQPQGSEMKQTH